MPVAETGDTQSEFGAALEELFRSVLRASGRGVPGGETELTMSQYFVMDALGEETLTVTEAARAARVAIPTATRALRALERRGFVERRRDDRDDRRLVTVALKPSGRAVLAEKRAWVLTRQREIFDGLAPAERRTAVGTLTAVAQAVDEL